MTNNTLPGSHKGIVQSIEAKAVTVRIDTDVLILPKKMFSPTVQPGDAVFLSIMTTEHYEKHKTSLAKEIINTILGKKT